MVGAAGSNASLRCARVGPWRRFPPFGSYEQLGSPVVHTPSLQAMPLGMKRDVTDIGQPGKG